MARFAALAPNAMTDTLGRVECPPFDPISFQTTSKTGKGTWAMCSQKKGRSCPRCGGTEVQLQEEIAPGVLVYACIECDHEFEVRTRFRGSRDSRTTDREEWDNLGLDTLGWDSQ